MNAKQRWTLLAGGAAAVLAVVGLAAAHGGRARARVPDSRGQVANLVLGPNATISQSGQTLTITLPAHGGFAFGLAGGDGGPGSGFGGPHPGFGREGGGPFERGPGGF